MRMTGAQAVMRSLEALDIDVMFGLPGGAILPAYDPLIDANVRHILVRHEQGAIHMAEGYAHATGRVGVCMATSGPGATNLITGLADAMMDSVPVLAITGQVPSAAVGSDAFQEADVTGISMPVTKHNELVTQADRIAGALKEAFHIAGSGRPGPVLVDIPKDILQAEVDFRWPDHMDLPGYRPTVRGHTKMVKDAIELISRSRKPVVYVGGGVVRAGAHEELRELVELLQLPLVTTLLARGAVDDAHPLNLGMPGMHGHWTAVTAMQEADLLIALGTRFDDRVTGKLSAFAPGARIIHVDVDPAEIGKNRVADIPIVGDAKVVIGQLAKAASERGASAVPDTVAWREQLRVWKEQHPLSWDQSDDGPLKPQTAIKAIGERFGSEAIYVAGVGQHQMWAAQLIQFTEPRRWINSGGLGTMGFAVPAAIGAKVGCPDRRVVCIDGDGCFQMTLQELATAKQHDIPVVFTVINNGHLGMVRQWQELFYDRRFSEVALPMDLPDLVKLAEAYQMPGFRASSLDELGPVLDKAFEIPDQPVLIDLRVDPEEKVFPMVPAGCGNDEIVESADEWFARQAGMADAHEPETD